MAFSPSQQKDRPSCKSKQIHPPDHRECLFARTPGETAVLLCVFKHHQELISIQATPETGLHLFF